MGRKKGFRAISFTLEQYGIVMLGIKLVREIEGDPHISKGRALELIVGDFLAGPYRQHAFEDALEDPWEDFWSTGIAESDDS